MMRYEIDSLLDVVDVIPNYRNLLSMRSFVAEVVATSSPYAPGAELLGVAVVLDSIAVGLGSIRDVAERERKRLGVVTSITGKRKDDIGQTDTADGEG